MNLTFPKLTKKSNTLIITLISIGLAYAFYFFVYVDSNEKTFNQKIFRNLEQTAKNIREKQKVYVRRVELIRVGGIKNPSDSLTKQDAIKFSTLRLNFEQKNNNLDSIKKLLTSITQKEDKNRLDKLSHEKKDIENEIIQLRLRLNQLNDKVFKKSKINSFNTEFGYVGKISSVEKNKYKEDDLKNIYYINSDTINEDESKYFLFNYSLERFVTPILNKRDAISEYIIVRSDSSISFQTFNNKIRIKEIDTLSYNRINPIKSKIININVQGISYKMFTYNFEFDAIENWLLIGFVKNSDYVKQTRSLNLWFIIYLFLLVLLLIVAIPLLKLALMNSIERLNRNNVFFSGMSIVIGGPLITLFFLIIYGYSNYEFNNTDDNLSELSSKVHDNFNREIINLHKKLKDFDSGIVEIDKEINIKLDNLKKYEFDTNKKIFKVLIDSEIKNKVTKKYFNEVFLMDKEGNQTVIIRKDTTSVYNNNTIYNIEKRTVGKVVLKGRAYFSNVINKKSWNYLERDSSLFIQSIVSWSTGQPEIAISTLSKNDPSKVIAITAKLKSVMDAILPMGYGFCFINADGEVQIHSDYTKNLQENFLEETNNNSNLISGIYARTKVSTTIDYLNKKQRALIKPINGTPFYLIVYYDLDLLKAKNSEIWSVSLALFLFSFVLVGFVILILYLKTFSSTKLFVKKFFFDWMTPKQELYHKYKKMIWINLVSSLVIVILYGIIKDPQQLLVFIILVLIPTISFILNYWSLNKYNKNLDKSLEPITNDNKSINRYYSLFLTSWLLQSALVPIILIYITYYNIESEIWTKHRLVDLSEKIVGKDLNSNDISTDSLNLYSNFIGIEYFKKNKSNSGTKDSILNNILYYLRPSYKNSIIENRGLLLVNKEIKNTEDNNDISILRDQISFTSDSGSVNLKYRKLDGKPIYLSQELKPFNLFTFCNIYSLIIFVILFALYRLIYFANNKIYGLQYSNYNKIKDEFKEQIKAIIEKQNVILIGLPGSSKLTRLKENCDIILNNDLPLIDCRSCDYKTILNFLKNSKDGDNIQLTKNYNLEIKKDQNIILDNFEYANNDKEINSLKLSILEELQKKRMRIIIVSELHPSEIIDYHYRNLINNNSDNSYNIKQEHQNIQENWRQIFSNFVLFYLPLYLKKNEEKIDNLYYNEIKYSPYLYKLNSLIKGQLEENSKNIETVILEIQQFANPYYFSLWNALTRREKFAVYDLADDEFINTGNMHVINTLLKKGIIRFDDKLKLMNKSFANFVLTIIEDGEVVEMDREVRKKGKWVNIKLVIILVLIGLIALIGFGQPDFFKNINAIAVVLIGAAGILPSLSRIFTLTQKNK